MTCLTLFIQHSKDRLFITPTEWARDFGGKKRTKEATFKVVPHNLCGKYWSLFRILPCLFFLGNSETINNRQTPKPHYKLGRSLVHTIRKPSLRSGWRGVRYRKHCSLREGMFNNSR